MGEKPQFMRVAEVSIDMGAFRHLTIERSHYPDGDTDFVLHFTPTDTVPRLSLWRRFARFMLREEALAPAGALTLRNVSQELAEALVAGVKGDPK